MSGLDQNVPFRQGRIAFQPCLDRLHGLFREADAFLVHLAAEFHHRMKALPGHALGPFEPRVHIHSLGAIPVLFQNALCFDTSASLPRIVFAVRGGVIQKLDGLADGVGEFDPSFEKLGASATAFRAVVDLDLQA